MSHVIVAGADAAASDTVVEICGASKVCELGLPEDISTLDETCFDPFDDVLPIWVSAVSGGQSHHGMVPGIGMVC